MTADSVTNNTAFAVVPGLSVTTDAANEAGFVEIYVSFSAALAAQGGRFRLTLDGVPIVQPPFVGSTNTSFSFNAGDIPFPQESGSIVRREAVTAGAHTIAVEWATGGAGGSVFIRPSLNQEHGSLLVKVTT